MHGVRRAGLVATSLAVLLALALPGAALAQAGATNPFAPLPAAPQTVQTATTPTVITPTSSSTSGGGFSGTDAVFVAVGALVLLGGISLFIWLDARRRAPVRHHTAATAGGTASLGSKPRPKPRKLSPAERRRRKRGRAK